MAPESVEILGIRVDKVTTHQTLDLVDGYVRSGVPHQIVTLNPEFVMRAQSDPVFRQVLRDADLALPDGQGLLWAARFLGRPLLERVTGSDTVPLMARLSAQRGYRLFLLGAAPGIAERAAAFLIAEYPGLQVAGTFAGSPDPAEEDEIVARVQAARPDFLFVAYGAPRQDLWIHRNLGRLGVPVCMGVGGTLDFIAGVVPRAPLWMREHGLEWLYRLIIQPSRWRRMLALPHFVVRVVWCKLVKGARS
ncbi:MAG: WecB/TagA/CpsF family glycosyltransferase [Anaerolineae bacterium]|nr:WecB/TagA/CpsF family glycosyltransferase [Anaerolineae bacterium]